MSCLTIRLLSRLRALFKTSIGGNPKGHHFLMVFFCRPSNDMGMFWVSLFRVRNDIKENIAVVYLSDSSGEHIGSPD